MALLLDGADPGTVAEPQGVRRILVAFDGSPQTWTALQRAIDIAVANSALLTIVAVVPEPRIYSGVGPFMLPFSPATLRRDAEREILRLIAAARDEVPANVSVTTQILHGRPARALATLAKQGDYDVVVTGPRCSGRLRRLLAT
jgi:nucleotide-binding universal stress UspA family protein